APPVGGGRALRAGLGADRPGRLPRDSLGRPPGLPGRPAADVGGVPVRPARGGDRRARADRTRRLGDVTWRQPLRRVVSERVSAPAAGVPGRRRRAGAGPARPGPPVPPPPPPPPPPSRPPPP